MNNDEQAFMMMEALIAILILATAGLSLLMVMQSSQKSALKIRSKICAQWVADNQIARWMIAPPPKDVASEKGEEAMCSDTWQWQVHTENSPDRRFETLQVSVYLRQHKVTGQYVFIPRR